MAERGFHISFTRLQSWGFLTLVGQGRENGKAGADTCGDGGEGEELGEDGQRWESLREGRVGTKGGA